MLDGESVSLYTRGMLIYIAVFYACSFVKHGILEGVLNGAEV